MSVTFSESTPQVFSVKRPLAVAGLGVFSAVPVPWRYHFTPSEVSPLKFFTMLSACIRSPKSSGFTDTVEAAVFSKFFNRGYSSS